ncbi:hypothetical protein [Cryptosporangium minutisporangium]|uniref:FXSXX-COOH protein n=1 Tax=Cryptosporangium minutisporangium TaxID=113569 RepID=A0ABP6SVD3_9ACTN
MLDLEFIEDVRLDEVPASLAGELAEMQGPASIEQVHVAFSSFV